MKNTTLILDGLPVRIRYQFYPPCQVEWHLDEDSDAMADQHLMLLEHLLRNHHNGWINNMLWEEHQAETYEADARAAALAEDISF